jgi:hypothetical protein
MYTKIIPPVAVFILLISLYCFTLAPGLSWANNGADGGDLITAAAINGVPHPTGYPLYMLLAKLFQWLPIGNLAYRTNLLSTFCTILAAFFVYQTIFYFKNGKKHGSISAIIAALVFGLSPLVWSQAVITEVYGLQSLLTIGILYQTIRMGNKPYEDILRGLLFGLALGNHITGIFLLPLLLLDKEEFHISLKSNLSTRFFGLLVGAAVYLILPLRAMNQPSINWFNPVTFTSFYKLVTGQIYQSYFSASYALDRARSWAGFLIENFSIPGVAIGIYAILNSENNKRFNCLVAWIFLIYGFFALFYASYDSYVYLIQTILAFSLWIGLSIDRIISYVMGRWHKAYWVLFPLSVLFFIFRIYSIVPKVNASNDDRAELFGQLVFDTVPDNAMIFTKDDHSTFALWYFHFAENQRPDIKVISEGLLEYDWYQQSLRTTYPNLIVPKLSNLSPHNLIMNNSRYPYCLVRDSESLQINCFQY